MKEIALLTTSERRVLMAFRKSLITPGQMLCFYGPTLKQNKNALEQLTERDFLIKERFEGGYSLTRAGFVAMKTCD